ncbi:hypothetical protein D0Y65_007635, partial [Glycine soja]
NSYGAICVCFHCTFREKIRLYYMVHRIWSSFVILYGEEKAYDEMGKAKEGMKRTSFMISCIGPIYGAIIIMVINSLLSTTILVWCKIALGYAVVPARMAVACMMGHGMVQRPLSASYQVKSLISILSMLWIMSPLASGDG